MGLSERRGSGGGRGNGVQQRGQRSGAVRESEGEEGKELERARGGSRRLQGSRGISRASRGKRQEAGGGRGTWARTVATRLSSYWREVVDDWQRRWAGPARWVAYWAVQVS